MGRNEKQNNRTSPQYTNRKRVFNRRSYTRTKEAVAEKTQEAKTQWVGGRPTAKRRPAKGSFTINVRRTFRFSRFLSPRPSRREFPQKMSTPQLISANKCPQKTSASFGPQAVNIRTFRKPFI